MGSSNCGSVESWLGGPTPSWTRLWSLSLAKGPNGPPKGLESAQSLIPPTAGPSPGGAALRAAPTKLGAEIGG
eukprot:35009-Alexandrium_andersonii.AAC.1